MQITAEEIKAVYNYLKINDYKQQTDDYIYFSPNEFVCQSLRKHFSKNQLQFPYYVVIDSDDYDKKFYETILDLGINRKDFKYRSKYGPQGLAQYKSNLKNSNVKRKNIIVDLQDNKLLSCITKHSDKFSTSKIAVSTFNEYFIAFRDKADCVLYSMRYNDKILACGDIHKILEKVKEDGF